MENGGRRGKDIAQEWLEVKVLVVEEKERKRSVETRRGDAKEDSGREAWLTGSGVECHIARKG